MEDLVDEIELELTDENPIMDENWRILVSMFPVEWKRLARSTKAVTRKLRMFPDEESVMRALLTHIACGYSLRETVTMLKTSNVADISDVALLKRLQCSEAWLKELCLRLIQENHFPSIEGGDGIRMRLVDGTTVKEPGQTGSLWRIHYSLTLPDLKCDYFRLTSDRGNGTGESFKQFPIKKGDCIVGDRGYCTSQGIDYVVSKGAHVLVRVNTSTLSFLYEDGKVFDLLSELRGLEEDGSTGEWDVRIACGDRTVAGRLVVVRKSMMAMAQALKRLKRAESRKQTKLKPATAELAKYVIVFTTLPRNAHPQKRVLEWYRYRWQIELAFKRLKSLLGLGHLPKQDEVSARAWLYGKLFTGLLIEKLIRTAKNVSPWGYI